MRRIQNRLKKLQALEERLPARPCCHTIKYAPPHDTERETKRIVDACPNCGKYRRSKVPHLTVLIVSYGQNDIPQTEGPQAMEPPAVTEPELEPIDEEADDLDFELLDANEPKLQVVPMNWDELDPLE